VSTLEQVMIAPPEPDVTPAEMIQRARSFQPRLRDEQEATERRGTYSPEMHDAFTQAGFYRLLQPRRFGGYEFDVPTFLKVITELARGCPASAWCLCLAAGHHIQMAGLFAEGTQAAVYGPAGHFAAPCRPIPMGFAERVRGGWRISGEWNYCSGAPYSTHALLAVRFRDSGTSHPVGLAVVPRDQWTLLDDWRTTVFGMGGSGSNSIRVAGAVVPDEFVVSGSLQQIPQGAAAPGYLLHGNPMYGGISEGFGPLEIAAILVGCACAATDEYERILREKKTLGPDPQLRYTAPEYQRWFSAAVSRADAAEDVLIRTAERYMECCRAAAAGGRDSVSVDAARINLITHEVTFELAWEAVEILFRTSGSSEGARNGSRMQRYYRDFSMARTNVSPKTVLADQAFASDYFGLGKISLL
jgi:3-hydroxy-9,10-secoandrosta-1,3,5(10)-triene-9,17-dione monooxygenase